MLELNKIYHGDCLGIMKGIPDNTVDAIVTDPPYGLSFMGKKWDYDVPSQEIWEECLRVLKPGGYLLAFSGTRTQHRMAVRIEDAGFEIRDMIAWVYGCLSEDTEILTSNGWKMLYSVFEGDYVFACDYKDDMKLQLEPVKQKFIYDYNEDAYHIKDTGYYNSELMETDHIVSKNHNVLVSESWAKDCYSKGEYPQKVFAEVLYENVQKRKELGYKSEFHIPGLNGYIPCTIEKIPYKGKVWCVEVESGAFVARRNGKVFITGNSGFPKSLNIGKAVDKLQGNEREQLPPKVFPDGSKDRKTANHKFYANEEEQENNYTNTKGTSEWEGWGTALKPALEPITVARKPLEKGLTVAENCLKWGVGGINIDGCRVGTETITQRLATVEGGKATGGKGVGIKQKATGETTQTTGRFPANLIHDGSDEVVELFPNSKSTPRTLTKNGTGGVGVNTNFQRGSETSNYSDSGSASRFFYCAKASKSERNNGLDCKKRISIMAKVLSPDNPLGTIEQPDQSQLRLLDIELYPLNDIGDYGINLKKGQDLNTSWYEKNITDQSLNECKYIIKTKTSGTIVSEILNWFRHCVTKDCTPDVNGEIEFGENLVENVEGGRMLTTIIKGKMGFLHDASSAVSEMQLIIREKENKNFHSTVKPIALMEYLVKLVSREGAIVLDPFAGSGSTLVACKNISRNYIGMEMTEEYIPIIEARLNAVVEEEPEEDIQPSLF